MVPHALELHAVGPQHLLDAHVLFEHTEIHPYTHAASFVLARIVNGWPLLSTAIRYATSLRATASVAWLRSPRCSSRLCTAAQLRVMARRQFGGLDQHHLQMFIALFGDRPPLFFAGRTALRTGQPAIAGRLPNGREPLHLSYFQRPGQGQDLTYAGNRLQSHHPLVELGMFPEALQQPPLHGSEKLHLSSTQSEQFHHRRRHLLQTP